MVASYSSTRDMLDELIHDFRLNITDLDTVRLGKAANTTETFAGDAIETDFELVNDKNKAGNHRVKVFRWVKVDGVTQVMYTDYFPYIREDAGKITFASPPANGAVILINYDQGPTWVYDANTRRDYTSATYPLASVECMTFPSEEASLGANYVKGSALFTVFIRSTSKNQIASLIDSFRQRVFTQRKLYYYIRFARDIHVGPVMIDPLDPNLHVYKVNVTFTVAPIWEALS